MSLRDVINRCIETVANSRLSLKYRMPDVDAQTREIYHRIAKYTMTSPERIAGLCQAVRYVTDAKIPGAYVECGVWRGGSSMAAALSFIAAGETERPIYLFDTFEGMSSPSTHDLRAKDGTAAAELLRLSKKSDKIWCNASIEDVTINMASTSYDMKRVTLCKVWLNRLCQCKLPRKLQCCDWIQIGTNRPDMNWSTFIRAWFLVGF
ncbi:TylF/MycF/NovP-related O-methyltransferase [Komagataeibacter melomenusus]|nr:TylF/MycF/NovP-related O-methyltransferase [Komagataeibacter melomenusus]